jgi:hypothetical protein
MSLHTPPSVGFAYGCSYRLLFDPAALSHVIVDSDDRTVAIAPIGFGGEAILRAGRWIIGTEQHALGWSLVATRAGFEDGRISLGTVPFNYQVLGGDLDAHVTQNPLTAHWRIRHQHHQLVRISHLGGVLGPDRSKDDGPRGVVKTHKSVLDPRPLGLLILLTLAMMRADATNPFTS